MLGQRPWTGTSKRLGLLLLAVVLPPALTLIWLGAQLVEQDRAVMAQRELDGRKAVGQAAALAMRQSLREAERLLDGGVPPDGIVRFAVSKDGLDIDPADRVLWTPTPRQLPAAPEEPFVEATRLEYQGDIASALNFYAKAATASDRTVRAGALRRLARLHWRARRWDQALATYRELEELRDVSDLGMPADLLARRNAVDVLEKAGRAVDVLGEARRLQQDLLGSTWSLDRDSWDLTAADLEKWLGAPVDVAPDRLLYSVLASELWGQLRSEVSRTGNPPPQRVEEINGSPVTLLSRRSDAGLTVVAVSPPVLQTWVQAIVDDALNGEAQLGLVAASGTVMAGTPAPRGVPAVTLTAADSGLPWTLMLHSDRWSQAGKQIAYRRQLLSIGLVSILLLLAGGSYFLWRVVHRELAVSRLQTDFVAAVSHEFRTPLTSLRHVTELLEEDDEMPAERRRTFYQVYRRNTERLHQLVESLLDFARMEAGRKAYERQPIDAAALATHVVAEFQRNAAPDGRQIELETGSGDAVQIAGDRAALVNALWNLLDNAVKYSPDGGPIRVSVRSHVRGVAIAVTDNGLGIGPHERDAIFQRFVRGRQAVELGIKGTGLGLAMVAHIVEAHGGVIEVESDPAAGSTFRLILPGRSVTAERSPRYEPA